MDEKTLAVFKKFSIKKAITLKDVLAVLKEIPTEEHADFLFLVNKINGINFKKKIKNGEV